MMSPETFDEKQLLQLSNILIIVGNMSYLPQMYDIIQSKSSKNISKMSYWISALTACGWLYYSNAMGHSQQVLSNSVWLGFTIATLFLLYKYDDDQKRQSENRDRIEEQIRQTKLY